MPGRAPHESNPILGFLRLLSRPHRMEDLSCMEGERERENGRSFRFATPNLSSPRKLGKASYVTLFASYHPFLVIPLFDPCSWNYIRIRYITAKLERKRGGKVSRESIYCNTSMGEIVNGGMKEGWVKRWMGMELNICS